MEGKYTKMNHILLYSNYERIFSLLSYAQVGQIVQALLHYLNTGKIRKLRGEERLIFESMLEQVQRNMEKYEKVCERNRNNAQKFWDSIKNVNEDATGTDPE